MPDHALPRLTAGLGLKPEHYAEARAARAPGLWFEVHAENYMVQGGPRLAWLAAIGEQHPLSLHGVGMSLAADRAPDEAHLARLRELVVRFQPALVSEHLAWSSWREVALPDLLPFPRTDAALTRIADNIRRVQEALGREIAVENPAHYLAMPWHEYTEPDFLAAIVGRTGCRLLLDVNNVYVGARNLGNDASAMLRAILDAVPPECIAEIHLAGFAEDPDFGYRLLIDSHDAPVDEAVWALYSGVIERIGPRPTLVERDGNIPAFAELMRERDRAHALLARCSEKAAA